MVSFKEFYIAEVAVDPLNRKPGMGDLMVPFGDKAMKQVSIGLGKLKRRRRKKKKKR
jgi:hypothetical protein